MKRPICLMSHTSTTDGEEFDCAYPDSPTFCEDCLCNYRTTGGIIDPRTGKKISIFNRLVYYLMRRK